MTLNFTLTNMHVRAGLLVVGGSSAVSLTVLLLRGAENLELPNASTVWLVLCAVLALGGVVLPVIGALGRFAPAHALRTPFFFLIPAMINPIFLNPQLSGFPVGILCIIACCLSLLGTIATLFNALDIRQKTSSGQSRLTE